MSPLEIEMLFHIDHRHEPLANLGDPGSSQNRALRSFVALGLIVDHHESAAGWRLTERGMAYVQFLQKIPLPVCVWRLPIEGLDGFSEKQP